VERRGVKDLYLMVLTEGCSWKIGAGGRSAVIYILASGTMRKKMGGAAVFRAGGSLPTDGGVEEGLYRIGKGSNLRPRTNRFCGFKRQARLNLGENEKKRGGGGEVRIIPRFLGGKGEKLLREV